MNFFDFLFFFGPLSNFLILHESSSHVETSLITNRRQCILKPSPLTIEFDVVKNIDSCGQPISIRKVLESENFRLFSFPVDLFWRIRISLTLSLSIISLNFDSFSFALNYSRIYIDDFFFYAWLEVLLRYLLDWRR